MTMVSDNDDDDGDADGLAIGQPSIGYGLSVKMDSSCLY